MAAISFGGEMKIELTVQCPNSRMSDGFTVKTEWCRGGTIWHRVGGNLGTLEATDEDCGECRGTGEVPTYEGTMIIDMVRTWLKE